MTPMFKLPALLAACAILMAGTASAQVFKCTNEAGKTVYSDAPCAHRAQQLDPNKLNTNTLDGSYHRRAADQDRAARQVRSAPDPYQSNQATDAPRDQAEPRAVCPTAFEIRNMETSANSITQGSKERDFLQAEVARAKACRQGGATYSRESWRALEDAQRQQNRIDNSERKAARRTAEEIHLSNGSQGVQQGVLLDRENEAKDEARRKARRHNVPPIIMSCDAGGCWDDFGNRYNHAGGGNLFRQDGRFCMRTGSDLMCN